MSIMNEEVSIVTTRKDGTRYRSIPSNITQICPFCQSKDIGSGSWTPDTCRNCGATYFWREWHKEITDDN